MEVLGRELNLKEPNPKKEKRICVSERRVLRENTTVCHLTYYQGFRFLTLPTPPPQLHTMCTPSLLWGKKSWLPTAISKTQGSKQSLIFGAKRPGFKFSMYHLAVHPHHRNHAM
jgi:hypothetical protein